MDREKFMREALAEAKKGDLPFGAIITKNEEIVIRGYNTTKTDNDVSAHGEINVLRKFTKKYGYSLDALNGYTLYTTCEPCPMCAAACVWAGVSTIVYGTSSEKLIDLGIEQFDISCETIIEKSFRKIEIIGGVLADECLELFKQL